jgi:hypothetical protein
MIRDKIWQKIVEDVLGAVLEYIRFRRHSSMRLVIISVRLFLVPGYSFVFWKNNMLPAEQ